MGTLLRTRCRCMCALPAAVRAWLSLRTARSPSWCARGVPGARRVRACGPFRSRLVWWRRWRRQLPSWPWWSSRGTSAGNSPPQGRRGRRCRATFLYLGIPARRAMGRRSLMSFCALALDLPKSRISCCCGTEAPSLSQAFACRASVNILSSCAGPQVCLSVPSGLVLFHAWTCLDLATHSFQIHRIRSHSPSREAWAADDTRSLKVYRAECLASSATRGVVMPRP